MRLSGKAMKFVNVYFSHSEGLFAAMQFELQMWRGEWQSLEPTGSHNTHTLLPIYFIIGWAMSIFSPRCN